MNRAVCGVLVAMAMAVIGGRAGGQKENSAARTFRLDSVDGVELVNAKAEVSNYRGRSAVHLVPLRGRESSDETMMAILTDTDFADGTIEAEVAGAPRAGAAPDNRGFIGILFRVQGHGSRDEDFYLRPTNGRSDDQLRRNHAVQYESAPDFPWYRLRKENPGVYESYADLEAGAWTKMKIVVSGTHARLYVNDAEQPCLIVNDLKNGETHGQIGFWAHATTEGYFSNLTVK
jgi:hypothetical protein